MGTQKENKIRFATIKIPVFIDGAAVIFIIGCACLDYYVINPMDYTLVSLSFDSLLSIVGVFASFFIPYLENKSFGKYGISPSDFKNGKTNTRFVYMNLLISAIVILLASAVFYMVSFSLSLLATLIVIVFYLCYFIVPKIYEYIRGDDAVLDIAKHQCECLLYDPDFEKTNDYHKSKELISSILFDMGLKDALKLFTSSKRKGDNNKIKEQDLFVFLIKLQNEYIDNVSVDVNVEEIMTHKRIREIIRNVDYVCSHNSIGYLRKFDSKTRMDIYYEICITIQRLASISENANMTEYFQESIRSILMDLINFRYFSKSELHKIYFPLISTIFYKCINENNEWFFKVFSDLCSVERGTITMHIRKSRFLFLMILYSIAYVYRFTGTKQISVFQNKIKPLLKECATNYAGYFESFKNVEKFSEFYKMYLEFSQIIDYLDHNSASGYGASILEYFVAKWVAWTIPLTFQNEKEAVDDVLEKLNDSERKFIHDQLYDVDYFEFRHWPTCSVLLEYGLIDEESAGPKLIETMKYIFRFSERQSELSEIPCYKGACDFAEKFSSYLSTRKEYSPDLDSKKIMEMHSIGKHANCEISFFVRRSATREEFLSAESTLNFDDIIDKVLSAFLRKASYNYSSINAYDDALIKEIIKFNPKYKYAPQFDDYCAKKGIHIDNCSDCEYLHYNRRSEVFAQDGFIKFNFKIDNIYIRNITEKEATACFLEYEALDKIPSIFILPRNGRYLYYSLKSIEEGRQEINKVKDTFVFLTININYENCIILDRRKIKYFDIDED